MSPLPEHVQRVVVCPSCRTERVTKAHPNVLIKCQECGEHFRVYTDSEGPGDAAPTAPPVEAEAGEETTADNGHQEPPPAPQPRPSEPSTAKDFVEIVGPVTFPTADPPPVADRPTPPPGPTEPPDQPPPLVDEPPAQGETVGAEPGGWRDRWRK